MGIVLSLTITTSFAHELPDFGDRSTVTLKKEQEIQLGNEVFAYLKEKLSMNHDFTINAYVSSLGHRLLANNPNQDINFRFYVINNNEINAFALPGGIVCINTGAILHSENESELASIMAHEIIHVSQKHISRTISNANKVGLASTLGMLASVAIASASPEASTLLMLASVGGGHQAMLKFSREHEQEADNLGISLLANAGFDPYGMPGFLNKLKQKYQLDDRYNMPEYLSTHPLSENRVIKAYNRAKQVPYRQVANSANYELIKSKLQLQNFATKQAALAYFSKRLNTHHYLDERATLYGLALALKDNQNETKALEILTKLSNTDLPIIQLETVKLELELGKEKQALARLNTILANHPNNPEAVALYSSIAIKKGKNLPEIAKLLERQSKNTPEYIELFKYKAKVYTLLNDNLNAYLAEADYLINNDQLWPAMSKLKYIHTLTTKDSLMHSLVQERISLLYTKIRTPKSGYF